MPQFYTFNMLKIRNLFVFYLFIFTCSCQNKQDGNMIINPQEAEAEKLFMSDYFSELEYISLETSPNCLIANKSRIYVFDDYVITAAYRQCFLFDRKSGRFIKEIGQYGKGPDEYNSTLKGYIVNEKTGKIYMGGGNHLLEYDLFNKTPKKIPGPSLFEVCFISDSLWVQCAPNFFGNNANRLVFFNREKVIDSIPNYQRFSLNSNVISIISHEDIFYRYNESVYYKNIFNDTLFKIIKTKIEPAWIFNLGALQPPYSLRESPQTLYHDLKKYSQIHSIFEADPFLFFSMRYNNADSVFLFDKKTHQTRLINSGKEPCKGFYNDIDGGLPFWPSYINSRQELVCKYEAHLFKENFNYSPDEVKDKTAHEKLKSIAVAIKEEDNPVIVIAKLKRK